VAARLQPQIGLNTAAERLRELLEGSYLWQRAAARNLQDPLSFRCVPRSHGALYDALSYARSTLEAELNAANDNPLVLVEEGIIVSVGNFDVAGLAMAFDLLRLAIANAVKVANERVQRLLWNDFSGLPSSLAFDQGPTNGLKPMGRWSAALTAEARSVANPVTLDYVGQVGRGDGGPRQHPSRCGEPTSSSDSPREASPTNSSWLPKQSICGGATRSGAGRLLPMRPCASTYPCRGTWVAGRPTSKGSSRPSREGSSVVTWPQALEFARNCPSIRVPACFRSRP